MLRKVVSKIIVNKHIRLYSFYGLAADRQAGASTSMIVDADCIQFELGGDKKVVVGGGLQILN